MSLASATSSENQSLADRLRSQDMDDPRQFLEAAAADEETDVLGLLKSSIHHLREEVPRSGDVGKVPSAAALLKAKQPDDWLIDQFGARGSMVVLGGATGASKSTLVYGLLRPSALAMFLADSSSASEPRFW